jgi:uncharacterized protein YabN with tetrapyrrole methylase and pyrophosphatase domain
MISETKEIVKKVRNNCPHDIEKDFGSVIKDLKEEIEEIELAIKNKDKDNIEEEIGDVLFNVLFLAEIANEKYDISLESIIKRINEKIKFRHPHVFENPRKVSKEEAALIWKERKKIDKLRKIYPESF